MSELYWTAEKPTKEGWYWYISIVSNDMSLLTIAQVVDVDGVMIGYIGACSGVDVRIISGNWAGPLIAPTF